MTDRLIDLASAAVQRVQAATKSVQQTEAAAKAVSAWQVCTCLLWSGCRARTVKQP